LTDPFNSMTDNIFTGGQSKDTNSLTLWQWTNNKPQAKDDIVNGMGAVYIDTSAGPTMGDKMLYVALDRYDFHGNTTVGVWFFQQEVTLNANGTFNGIHTNGDVLLVADFSSSTATVTAFEWVGDDATGSLIAALSLPAGSTAGFVNTAAIPVAW